jgi:hypothetical protein
VVDGNHCKSAFIYSVFEALKQVSTSAVLSNRQSIDRVSAILESLKFKQIPMLYEPANAPDLEDKSFITLQPIPAATTTLNQVWFPVTHGCVGVEF